MRIHFPAARAARFHLPRLSRSLRPSTPHPRLRLLRHLDPSPCCRPLPHQCRPSRRLPSRSSLPLRIPVPFPQEISKNCPSGFQQEYSPPSLARQGPRQAPAGTYRRECSLLPRYLNLCARLPRRSTSASLRRRPELASAVV